MSVLNSLTSPARNKVHSGTHYINKKIMVAGIEIATIKEEDKSQPKRLPLQADRIQTAKAAITTKRVPIQQATQLLSGKMVKPRAGDLVLARVTQINRYKKLELHSGRRAQLFVGDEIIVCYGNRYASDQYEAYVPDDLGPCQLVAAGGIAACMTSKHGNIQNPTEIEPIGILAEASGKRLNLINWALPIQLLPSKRPPIVAVVGTSMNSGKTTSVSSLIRGLTLAGYRVGAAKVTGTGSGPDRWSMLDAGAKCMVDFSDAGFVSTFLCSTDEIKHIMNTLINHLITKQCDVILLEVADGIIQKESASLINSEHFKNTVDGVLFAAGDAMGALAGVQWLQQHCQSPVLGITGLLTSSPLSIDEVRQNSDVRIIATKKLSNPKTACKLVKLTHPNAL